ncbi:M20/M25/M40 family metallo-hydrolase [Sporosarcina oncorhynchi]|uniref:M20/M25/M40 family metallo-hydrolase n=1 Tax=Sporosarcina oncorhynchi TaxID=3056444 RepID=A0ABZ0L760_9BACL|nr:M20/M25/M40 family metallo-hydrolase [Sporosarcina sp. T2O-4]WOV88067.1 M20/M25/M40 family metallo-hydrolase [Sporosarcina sp. T2O-4]
MAREKVGAYKMDSKLLDKTVKLLQELIQTDTTNEYATEIEAANVLIEFFNGYEIESEIILSPEGRANFVATLVGEQQQEPLILLSHLDVVGPGSEEWTYPPFSGAIDKGVVWGRGTLDTKQLTAMHAAVFVEMKRLQDQGLLQRTVIFLATADEENGSQEGMAFIAEQYSEYFTDASVFSEGGGFIVEDNEQRYMFVAAGEKGTAKVKLKSVGVGGHAGAPPADQALLFLVSGLTSLLQQSFDPPTYSILENYMGNFKKTIEKSEQTSEDEIFIKQMYEYMKFPTVTIEKVDVGQQINVVPYYAEATIEIRTLPMQTKQDVTAILEQLFQTSNVEWEITFFQQGYECEIATNELRYIENTSAQFGYPVAIMPFTALGKTDGRFIGTFAANIYGISPVMIPFTEVLKRVHATDERIELDSFEYGTKLLVDTITYLARKEVEIYADSERES